jgi:hypothetical protein
MTTLDLKRPGPSYAGGDYSRWRRVMCQSPERVIQMSSPGHGWASSQPGVCLVRWHRGARLHWQVGPPLPGFHGMTWLRSQCSDRRLQVGNAQVMWGV